MIRNLLSKLLLIAVSVLLALGIWQAPAVEVPLVYPQPRIRMVRPKGSKTTSLAKRRRWYANVQSYGFWKLADLASQRVTQVGVDTVNTAALESVEAWQREVDQLLSLLVERVTWQSKRFMLAGAGTLQPLDEHGNPLPMVPSGFYDVALPIQDAGTAWGDDRVTRAKMTVGEADNFTSMVLQADADWIIRHILAAWYTNVTWTYPDKQYGSLTIQPLANADTVTYVRRNGTAATDTHFFAQAAAIDNANNPYPTIYSELSEHPSNAPPFVAYIPSNLKATTVALSNFNEVQDPDVRASANSDTLVGELAQGFGDEVLGKVDNVWIVQWDRLPNDYILGHAQGAPQRPFAMREHPESELQGLFPEFQDVNGNQHLNKFIRMAGFGAHNRVGALVYRIGNASYAIPTGFTAPLAV